MLPTEEMFKKTSSNEASTSSLKDEASTSSSKEEWYTADEEENENESPRESSESILSRVANMFFKEKSKKKSDTRKGLEWLESQSNKEQEAQREHEWQKKSEDLKKENEELKKIIKNLERGNKELKRRNERVFDELDKKSNQVACLTDSNRQTKEALEELRGLQSQLEEENKRLLEIRDLMRTSNELRVRDLARTSTKNQRQTSGTEKTLETLVENDETVVESESDESSVTGGNIRNTTNGGIGLMLISCLIFNFCCFFVKCKKKKQFA